LLCLSVEIVVAPPAVDGFIALKHPNLMPEKVLNAGETGGVAVRVTFDCILDADERLDAESVGPDVVNSHRRGSSQIGKALQKMILPATNNCGICGVVDFVLDEGRRGKGGDCELKGSVGSRDGSEYVETFGLAGGAP